jgi:hypothetical protein
LLVSVVPLPLGVVAAETGVCLCTGCPVCCVASVVGGPVSTGLLQQPLASCQSFYFLLRGSLMELASSCASRLPCAPSQQSSAQWRRWSSTSACDIWTAITTRCRSSRCCTALADTWLVMRYRLAASSASSASSSQPVSFYTSRPPFFS